MRILTLCYEFPPIGGGGSRVVYGLTRELAKHECKIDLITMAFGKLPRREFVHNVNVCRTTCLRTKASMSYIPELAVYAVSTLFSALKLVRKTAYDLIHAHFIFPDGLIAFLLKKYFGIPYIITAHGSDVPGYNPNRFRLAHRLLLPVWKQIVENASNIVCPSQVLESLVLRSFPGAKTSIIPNGVHKVHRTAGFKDRKGILIVTRMFERKGVQYFLKGLENLNLDCDINIVGDGPYLDTLKMLATQMKLPVRFKGWLDHDSSELQELYQTSGIFVLASEMENCPMVLLEAMSHGMAIITTEGTGCAEVTGDAAILIPPRNSEALGRAVCNLAGDAELCEKLSELALRRFEERYQWHILARDYRHLYETHRRRD